jgi:antiviral helicase SKI2
MSELKIFNSKFDSKIEKPIFEFPFELDDFQKHAHEAILRNDDIIISCPTSSGKTLIAEMAILNTIKSKRKAILTTPVKSLSNDIFNNFRKSFAKYNITVGILTGDIKLDPDADVLIVTNEILRNSLYQLKKKPAIELVTNKNTNIDITNIGCVIIDEIHMFLDADRGGGYEETVVLLPSSVQLIGLSATINEPEKFAEWINLCRKNPISLVVATKRIIPLKHFVYFDKKLYEIMNNDLVYDPNEYAIARKLYFSDRIIREKKHKTAYNPNIIKEVVSFLKNNNLLQTIFFSFSKKKCEQYAEMITEQLSTTDERQSAEKIFDKYMINYYQGINQVMRIKEMILRGVAFHHSGLLPRIKEVIEIIFKAGLIKILFATETLSVGINLPCRSVIFTELIKHTNREKRFITTSEYRQMSGRAGRRGHDICGYSIILPIYDYPDEHDLKSVLLGTIPRIKSSFKWDYRFVLKTIQSDATNLEQFFNKSLINYENTNGLTALLLERNKMELEICNMEDILQKTDSDILAKLYKLKDIESKHKSFNLVNQIKLNMNKKDKKIYDELVKYTKSTDVIKNAYNIMISIEEKKMIYLILEQTIKQQKNFILGT